MATWARILAVVLATGAFSIGCASRPGLAGDSGSEPPKMSSNTNKEKQLNGMTSPSGETHPGTIIHDHKVDGRQWTENAADVPQTIAWAQVESAWVAVVRIEITGTSERLRMTRFGPDGQMLESTIQSPPSPSDTPAPSPVPTPTPTSER